MVLGNIPGILVASYRNEENDTHADLYFPTVN